jgi:hypothetical protein
MRRRKVSAPLAKLREINAANIAKGEPVFVEVPTHDALCLRNCPTVSGQKLHVPECEMRTLEHERDLLWKALNEVLAYATAYKGRFPDNVPNRVIKNARKVLLGTWSEVSRVWTSKK